MRPEELAHKYILIQRARDGNYEASLCSDDSTLPRIRICSGSAADVTHSANRLKQILAAIIGQAMAEQRKAGESPLSPIERGVLTSS